MTPPETVLLTEYVRDCCPQQHIGEYTPDAWFDLLGDLTLADCKLAVAAVAKRQPFVAPAEIRAEVRAIRDKRLAETEIPPPPPETLDDPAAYSACLRAAAIAIADGRDPHPVMKAIARQHARPELEAS
jgi:hypothetical protein